MKIQQEVGRNPMQSRGQGGRVAPLGPLALAALLVTSTTFFGADARTARSSAQLRVVRGVLFHLFL